MSMLDALLRGLKNVASDAGPLPMQPTVLFTGTGVTCSDSSSTGQTIVNINAGGASQYNTSLANGLNSNVPITNSTSIRFGGYTGSVILGGIAPVTPPTPGQTYDLAFTVVGQPVTIRNLDASSSSGNRILTGTGGDVLLPPGQAPRCRLVWDATSGAYQLQTSGVHQVREYNVLDWGFDASGTNPCDTQIAALAASVSASIGSAVVAAGSTALVFFPRGVYLFNDPVPSFPAGTVFEGAGLYNAATTIEYSGTGIFWSVPTTSHFKKILFTATYSNTGTNAAPSQANFITGATNAAPIVITTAQAHEYSSGDQVGIYGITGNTAANSDPATPWTITVTGPSTFSLNGSTGNGSYTATPHTITNVTNASGGGSAPCVVTTSAAHGLVNGQLVWIENVTTSTGNANAYNGLQRVFNNLPADTTTFPVARNLFNNVQAGSGNYASGGTVLSGGVCLEYSRVALVALSSLTGANIVVEDCVFFNWKYGISLDGAELCHINRCEFASNGSSVGYTCDQGNNDSTHSSVGIRIGGFVDLTPGVANFNWIDKCNFQNTYAGTYHHDGASHFVTECNYEINVVAIISNAENLVFDECENDGSFDQLGLFQVKADASSADASSLSLYDCIWSDCISSMVWIGPSGSSLAGLVVHGGSFANGGETTAILGDISPCSVAGFRTDGADIGGSSQVCLPNGVSGQSVFTGGTTINHYTKSAAALDIGFLPLAGTSPAKWPAILIRNPQVGAVFSNKNWTPTDVSTFGGGAMQEFDDILGTSTPKTAARKGEGMGFNATLAAGSSIVFGTTDLPPNSSSAGTITMTVQAYCASAVGATGFWKFRQRFSSVAGTATLGAIDEYEVFDNVTGVTPPTMALIGSAGAQQVQCTANPSATEILYWIVKFEIDAVGQG